MKQVLTDFPEAKWHQYEPVNRDNARAGAIMAFGQDVHTTYDFSKADRILSLGSDFLSAHPGNLRYARHYAAKRRAAMEASNANQLSRLYVIEHADDYGSECGSSTIRCAQSDAGMGGYIESSYGIDFLRRFSCENFGERL